jgi:hypothetical protein
MIEHGQKALEQRLEAASKPVTDAAHPSVV